MDKKTLLRRTLLALEETVRGVASSSGVSKPSPAVVKQINSVFAEINKIVPESHFAMFDTYPDPIEVVPQIKLALEIIGEDSPPDTEDQASRQEPAQTVSADGPSCKSKPVVFIGCSVEGLTEAKLIQLELAHSANTVIWSQGRLA